MSEKDPQPAADLSPRQRKLLELMLKGKQATAAIAARQASPTLPRRNPSDPPVLSFAQQRLWFIQQLQPGTAAYNIPSGVRLSGPLDAGLFQRALAETVRRHETLRTTFALVEDRPLQLVAPGATVTLPIIDLTGLAAARRERQAQGVVNGLARKPFDMAAAPPWRAVLVRIGAEDHVFLAVMHHILSDTWTTGVFFREMVAHYRASAEGRPAQVPDLPIQYADYAGWQWRELQEEVGVLSRQLAYWQRRFAGAPPLLALPTDRPRPTVSSFRGGRIALLLPNALTDRLRALSGGEDATLFMTLMAAYQTLLLRQTGQEDVLVGTPMANRTRVELENLIGVFVNTLVLRTGFAGNPSFRAILRQVREATLTGLSNHDVPFEKVVEALQLERDTSRNPLFQALFAFQNVPIPKLVAEGLTLERFDFEETTARLDVELDLQEMPTGFVGWIGYNADLFDRSTMLRWTRSFLLLLGGLAEQPDLPVWDLPFLDPAERHQLLREWNATAAAVPELCLHELVAARATQAPEALALVAAAGAGALSYGELDRRARGLAGRLCRLGIGPETLVGLCAERSPEMVVGMLAVLQAGGAYLPLDPDYPRERLAFLLGDARPAVVLVEEHLLDRLPEAPGVERLPLGAAVRAAGGETAEDWGSLIPRTGDWLREAPEGARPQDQTASAAYAIYTSGSTGKPKGAINTHRGIVNRLLWHQAAYPLTPHDKVLQKTPFSFDVSVWEIFWPLVTGATLELAVPGGQRDSAYLARTLAEREITHAHFVPSLLPPFLAEPGLERLTALRRVQCSGEALSPETVRLFAERLGGVTLINLYGPTEAAVDVTAWRCPLPGAGREVPIGRPIANTAIHLLDGTGQPVPLGASGELAIGGIGVARGYLERPELTAERFVPDPFAGRAGRRLYRTGDLARFRPGGEIEFLGRIDHQVKIRGFRIELGEIESALARHPALAAAALLAREGAGGLRLVAYVVPRPGQAPNVSELYAYLKERLPDYMVPAVFVMLDALPMTASGKLDRRALPPPPADGDRPDLGAEYADPQGETERRIAELWRRVLKVDRIGRNDNFFELGGHSLLLTQVHRELREIAPGLTLVDMFAYPTIGALAGHLSRASRRSAVEEARERAAARRVAATEGADGDSSGVAIIGMALRFPGAGTPEQFWQNLKNGVESISFYSREEVIAAGVAPEQVDHPDYVRAEGDILGVDLFDPEFFGYTDPAEVEILDPQQRIFMECAWESLESAGYDPATYPGLIGIFAGVNISSYLFSSLYDYDPMSVMSSFQTRIGLLVGNQNDFLCTRVSYQLNLRGPSITVQTACSTATVAVHLACQSLLRRECDMCLSGGVQIRVPQAMGYLYQEGGFPSPDGHCRSFDARGKGNVHGNGAGVVLLKRLADARRDGDHVYAVIKGSAACNDGSAKVGFTAPGVEGQSRAAAEALAVAGVHPDSIGYLEATGTATELGDPIEIEALTRAYGAATRKKGFCPIGSVKSNIGHLDAASGAAALIKTALALERELIPPSLHFETPNPRIDFAGSPFFVNTAPRPWPRSPRSPESPRRAAVHTYAVGGTNTHLILEEPPEVEPSGGSRPWQLLLLSARTTAALHAQTENLAGYLAAPAPARLPDVAYTLQVGRRAFAARRAVLCRESADAVATLSSLDPERVSTGLYGDERRSVVLILPGEEVALRPATAEIAELYAAEPGFRAALDRCAEILAPLLGLDLRPLLGCGAPEAAAGAPLAPAQAEPARFAFEYALAQLWMEWGVTPHALFGWGVGELVAACLAGVLALADALALAVARGRALAGCPVGSRLEIELAEESLAEHLGEGIAVEAVLGPARCRVAGPEAAIEALQERLNELGVDCFHSGPGRLVAALDAAAREGYRQALDRVTFESPRLALIASETGAPLPRGEAVRTAFWERQLRATARLGDGLRGLANDPQTLLLGLSPGDWMQRIPEAERVLASLGGATGLPAPARLLATLGRLWVAGAELDGPGFYRHERRRRVPLPTYPFERRRIWAEPKIGRDQAIWRQAASGARREVPDWFYALSWRRSEQPAPAPSAVPEGTWLILGDAAGLGDRLAERLRELGRDTVAVRPGLGFEPPAPGAPGEYRIDPWRFADYAELLADLAAAGRRPVGAVHLWGVSPDGAAEPEAAQDVAFWSLHHLARALGEPAAGEIRLAVVACGTQEVTGEEELHPERAACLSACKVIPWEIPGVLCRAIDVTAAAPGSRAERRLVEQLLGELARDPLETVVAYRGGHRWVQGAERLQVETPAGDPARLRPGGTYLIAGGLTGFGFLVAGFLARTVGARLALVGDLALPPRESWDGWLSGRAGDDDDTVRLLAAIRRWEELGSEVLLVEADLGNPAQVRAAVGAARTRFGPLHGVFYAAGEPGEEFARPIAELDRDFYDYRLRARLSGLLALAESLDGEELDFVLLASTLASVTGGPATAVDCLADTFLDLFARRESRRGPTPWTSVDWDAFRLPGASAGGASPSTAITPEEGVEAFASLLALGPLPQVVVSTVDLPERLVAARQGGRAAARASAPQAKERPPLHTSYVGPRNEIEHQVAGIWAEILGLRDVGVLDDFFDLGGNSLVATQLVSRLRGALQVNLALQDFFEGATVAAIAERVRVTRWAFQATSGPTAAIEAMTEMEELGEI